MTKSTPDLPIINIARDTIALGPHRRDLVLLSLVRLLHPHWYQCYSLYI